MYVILCFIGHYRPYSCYKVLGDVLLDLVHETDLVCSIDCRGCNLTEQIIPSVLQSMGVNPYALFAKQEVFLCLIWWFATSPLPQLTLIFTGWITNTIRIWKKYRICVVEGQFLTPQLLHFVTGSSTDSDAICEIRNCPRELPLLRHEIGDSDPQCLNMYFHINFLF